MPKLLEFLSAPKATNSLAPANQKPQHKSSKHCPLQASSLVLSSRSPTSYPPSRLHNTNHTSVPDSGLRDEFHPVYRVESKRRCVSLVNPHWISH
ncbi:hypothetical protein TNCV_3817811 [Trichonephila clavipes]|nr:hypothetical protein TNCV_3817811 [Trichonephila clavipes]